MFIHLPRLINRWSSHHKNFLYFITGASIASFAGSIMYAVLPVVIALHYGELYAGIIISVFCMIEALIADPIAGNLADRIGSRKTVMLGYVLGILAGLLWLIFPFNNIFVLLLFSLLLFASFGFRNVAETYILRTTKRDEGGIVFGLFGNTTSLAIFLATASLPFFVILKHVLYAAWTLVLVYGAAFIVLYFVADDIKKGRKEKISKTLNPWPSIKSGWHFVRINNLYPILSIGATLFEGLFYGAIWFVFPLHLAKIGISGGEGGGLNLGIYDLVTVFIAGYSGYLADKYNWKHIHTLGWILVIMGLIALPFYGWPIWLIIVGAIIGIGNNLSYYAAAHALEANDIDHREDGAFIGLKNIMNSMGYAISPLMAGFLYSKYGFSISLAANSLICLLLVSSLIWFTWKLENK